MRCSLLALSSYLDAELDSEPAGELEAHLLACDRCRTAIGYLREESERIAGLARVHLPDDAVHALFSQIGLIREEDDLPPAPEYHDRPVSVEAPPWFGVERGKALPWAPRGAGHDPVSSSPPRELIGGRSPSAVAEPPELFLWDEPMDQIETTPAVVPVPEPAASPVPPPVAVTPAPVVDWATPQETAAEPSTEAGFEEPQPPAVVFTEPQPPDLASSAPFAPEPSLAHPPNAFHRLRDAVAVRMALWRGGAQLDSKVEIVSGAGAPTWNERAHPKSWTESPPIVALPDQEPKVARALPPAGVPDIEPLTATPSEPVSITEASAPATATGASDLAGLLNEVAMLAAPLERSHPPAEAAWPAVSAEPMPVEPAATRPAPMDEPIALSPVVTVEPISPLPLPPLDQIEPDDSPVQLEPGPPARPGRHMRRLKAQRPERRSWDPTKPVTGRHVLPIGGPAVGAADRDRRLWMFGAATVAVMIVGLLVGKDVVQPPKHASTTVVHPRPTAAASTPVTQAPLPIATPLPAVTVPPAPSAAQLTGVTKLGTGAAGFSVADVRYGQHPNDFRLVFDLAFPDTVSGAPATVIGFDGSTTMYIEFTGVTGTAPVASPPPGQVVASLEPLPMARDSDRLVFKITLRHKAPFDAYYLSGGRLIIDIT